VTTRQQMKRSCRSPRGRRCLSLPSTTTSIGRGCMWSHTTVYKQRCVAVTGAPLLLTSYCSGVNATRADHKNRVLVSPSFSGRYLLTFACPVQGTNLRVNALSHTHTQNHTPTMMFTNAHNVTACWSCCYSHLTHPRACVSQTHASRSQAL
jgi:hypothetical protein